VVNEFSVLRYHVLPRWEGDDIYGATDLAVPVVDSVPVFEIVGDRWPGVPAEWVLPPSEHWLGSPVREEFGKAVVLDGSCGEAECCGVFARVSFEPDTVVWDQFDSPGAPGLPEGLRFEFAREDYVAQLRDVATVEPIEWVETDGSAY